MWVRLMAILLGIVFFITGCNSLISQFFGTHKLRVYTMEEAVANGIGDADYIRLTNAWQPGDYIVVPPRNAADKPILIFPLLSVDQLKQAESGEVVQPGIIAWTKNFSMDCDKDGTCAPRVALDAEGILRDLSKDKNKSHLLPPAKYQLPEQVNYLEIGRHPLAWYWNLLMLVGGMGLAVFIEGRAQKVRKQQRQQGF